MVCACKNQDRPLSKISSWKQMFSTDFISGFMWFYFGFKADFQSVLRSLSALMFVSLTNIRGKSMLFLTNCLPYLWGPFKFFFQQFPWVLQLWSFFIKWYQKERNMKPCIEKWRLTWNFEFTSCSRCKMLHFVISYMKQNTRHKQTPESAQNGLEISFNFPCADFDSMGWWVRLGYRVCRLYVRAAKNPFQPP